MRLKNPNHKRFVASLLGIEGAATQGAGGIGL